MNNKNGAISANSITDSAMRIIARMQLKINVITSSCI
jgi:hypothetical protein